MSVNIKENLEKVRKEIEDAELSSGREKGCVKLIAVSKFHPLEEIQEAISLGQFIFGENRVQEAYEKFSLLKKSNSLTLQIIGQLQTNKVKKAVEIADVISSVDRIELLDEIQKQCEKINKNIDILLEIHTAEESKSGFRDEKDIFTVLEKFSQKCYKNLNVKGFMTMAPFTDEEKIIRKSFIQVRELKEKAKKEFPALCLDELSMGMSSDFKIAIEEGSTQVRIGTSIFGERVYK